jgi:hypothetical protein
MSVRTFALLLLVTLAALAPRTAAQGGPPYYTNDPGTPGNLNWEINLGYMPFSTAISPSPTCPISISISASAIASNSPMKTPG